MMKQPPGGDTTPPAKKKGVPQQGRPKNSNDKTTRKTKTFKPKTKASIEIWAQVAQVAIAEVVNPFILHHYDKKNMRSLTKSEAKYAELTKFAALCHMEPLSVITEETIHFALSQGSMPVNLYSSYCEWIEGISTDLERTLTLDELKCVQACVYASYTGEE